MDSFASFAIAHAAMVFGCFVPALMIFCSTFCTVRCNRDPARTAFTYLKYALVTFSLYALFAAANSAFNAVYNILVPRVREPTYDYDDVPINVLIAMGYARPISVIIWTFFEMVTDILIMVILLRLCTGILMVHHASILHSRPYFGEKLRLASYGAAFVLSALALAALGLNIGFLVGFDGSYLILARSTQVIFAFKVFVFVISLGIVVKTVMVKINAKSDMGSAKTYGHIQSDRNLTWVSNMLIASSVVWLLHTSFNMASFAAWNNLESPTKNSPMEYLPFYYIFEALFNIWPEFITLVLVYLMGRKKENGIRVKQEKDLPPVHVNAFGPAYTISAVRAPVEHYSERQV